MEQRNIVLPASVSLNHFLFLSRRKMHIFFFSGGFISLAFFLFPSGRKRDWSRIVFSCLTRCNISGGSRSTGYSRPKTGNSDEPSEETGSVCAGAGSEEAISSYQLVGKIRPSELLLSIPTPWCFDLKLRSWHFLYHLFINNCGICTVYVGPAAQKSLWSSALIMRSAWLLE